MFLNILNRKSTASNIYFKLKSGHFFVSTANAYAIKYNLILNFELNFFVFKLKRYFLFFNFKKWITYIYRLTNRLLL